MSNLIGQLLGKRYLIERLVARGGMAAVYLATDQRLDRQVAVKIIHPHLAGDPEFQEKFVTEAKIAAKLSHPNLVNVFDQGADGENTFLVMEYVKGITLRDALKEYGALPTLRALDMLALILAGLATAHSAGILHRDLKPENILLADDGRVKLGDFGLARSITEHTDTGNLVGTVAYLSPELITRGIADARSDIYSAGIMLFELLTGRQPFEGEQALQIAYQHANSEIPAPSSFVKDIPVAVDQLVLWITSKNANDRPDNAAVLLLKVRQLINELKNGKNEYVAPPNLHNTLPLQTTSSADTAAQTVIRNYINTPSGSTTEIISGSDLSSTEIIGHLDNSEVPPIVKLGKNSVSLKLLIATLLVIILSSGAGWWFGSGPGALGVVPSLTSKTVSEARNSLAYLAPKIMFVNETSLTVTKGLVTRTDPAAGSYVQKNAEFKIFLSLGPKLIAVPDLAGLNVAEATTVILGSGFRLGSVTSWFSTRPIGQIYDYLGADGAPIPEGSAIELKVSLGQIPVVSGIDQTIAIAAIEATGLKISSITREFSDTVAPNKAIGILPLSQPLGSGGSVRLIVSKGPNLVIMPAVLGETVLAAKALLESLGLSVTINTDQLNSKLGIVKVKRASVATGTKLKAGDSVTISTK